MLKRTCEAVLIVAILGLLVAMLVPALRNSYVPTPDQLQLFRVVTNFQVMPTELEGVYGNYDTDALVFRYLTTAGADTFTATIDEQASTDGWMKLPSQGNALCYERITPKGGRMFCGAEQVRVRLEPETKRVSIGWVQGDSLDDVASFSETHESNWAESKVWPKLDTQ